METLIVVVLAAVVVIALAIGLSQRSARMDAYLEGYVEGQQRMISGLNSVGAGVLGGCLEILMTIGAIAVLALVVIVAFALF